MTLDPHKYVKRAAVAALWTPRDTSETLTPRVLRILRDTRPQVVMIHARPDNLEEDAAGVWEGVLRLAGGVAGWRPRLWLGAGCDTAYKRLANREWDEGQSAAFLARGAQTSSRLGAELHLWNNEAGAKLDLASARRLTKRVVSDTRSKHPLLVQGHTAYYAPGYHAKYPWAEWCGEDGVDVALPQLYVAPPEPEEGPRPFAAPSAMRDAMALHRRSWAAAIKSGMIRGSLPVWPYLQLHHTRWPSLVTAAMNPTAWSKTKHPVGIRAHAAAFWTVEKDRCDAHGEYALRVCAEMVRRELTVEQIQRTAKLKVDGLFGPQTARALLPDVPIPPDP